MVEQVDQAAEYLRVRDHYRGLTDGELLALARNPSELTDAAQQKVSLACPACGRTFHVSKPFGFLLFDRIPNLIAGQTPSVDVCDERLKAFFAEHGAEEQMEDDARERVRDANLSSIRASGIRAVEVNVVYAVAVKPRMPLRKTN